MIVVAAGALTLLATVVLHTVLQPAQVTAVLLTQVGQVMGLEISARGSGGYRLRGTPMLVLRDVVAHEPGASVPILRAERILIAVPWSTLCSRGRPLSIRRVELDAPILSLPAYQAWQAKRPPSKTRIPTLTDGLLIRRGRIEYGAWRIADFALFVPKLAPEHAVDARTSGRFEDGANAVQFDLRVALSTPAASARVLARGSVQMARDAWRIEGNAHLSGPMELASDGLSIVPANFGYAGHYLAPDADLPLRIGAHGPFAYRQGVWRYGLAAVLLRGDSLVPDLRAHGAFALGNALVVRLQGQLQQWPQPWPALPPPIGASKSPLPFSLDYLGPTDLSAIAHLRLNRDAAFFDARFRLLQVTQWLDARGRGSPLPPLDGRLTAPRLDIASAQLRDVSIVIDEPEIADGASQAASHPSVDTTPRIR